ncbi:MAG: hypothetical protein AAGG01_01265 [Planctomycetota bacterium]
MGFHAGTVTAAEGEIDFFVSTEGAGLDRAQRLPLVVFLQGSGPHPIYFGDRDRPGRSTLLQPADFPGHHYVVLSKPGLTFHAKERTVASDEYQRRTSLEHRVQAVVAVIEHLVEEPWVDPARVVLVGHSEGADVAPWAAAACGSITHVAVLAPGALSQMVELAILERAKEAAGEQSAEETSARLESQRDAFRMIFQDPKNWRRSWRGHSFLRWSSFCVPAVEAYLQLDIPILAIAGRHDRSTPVESGEALQLGFIRAGKDNLTFEVWPMDHYLTATDGGKRRDCRPDALRRIFRWLGPLEGSGAAVSPLGKER